MKKMAIAGLLAAALSLTALSEQRAAAGCWNFNIGLNLTMGGSWCCGCPNACPPGFCWGYQGCPTGDCGYYGAPYAAPCYAAAPTAPVAPVAPAPAVQNAGYYYPADYGYGAYQVPSYWYGR